jgi:hypothetical protein
MTDCFVFFLIFKKIISLFSSRLGPELENFN